jgi:hypothetical protein
MRMLYKVTDYPNFGLVTWTTLVHELMLFVFRTSWCDGVDLSAISIISMFWYPFYTSIAPI